MTVEGENDDISGVGQTEAAHATLHVDIPADRRAHYVQKGVGHYGVFNGSRFRAEIVPRISDFMRDGASSGTRERRGMIASTHAIARHASRRGRATQFVEPHAGVSRCTGDWGISIQESQRMRVNSLFSAYSESEIQLKFRVPRPIL